jgi:NADH-quinone oxidoreductase subunit L
MVTFRQLLIFIYSLGYMAHDENFTRFFCFLSLFAAAMLGVVIANSLLLFFICWELVGLASYLLIGFWFQKPSAAAAAKKAFITTRIGDSGLLLGMLWLYSQAGTLLFYDDGGHGCLEIRAGAPGPHHRRRHGVSTAIRPADFLRRGRQIRPGAAARLAAGRDGRPDAGQRADPRGHDGGRGRVSDRARLSADVDDAPHGAGRIRLVVVTWVGAITAVFAASIAVAQNDIKRILAYSTVSQLGYMMMGLGVGGVAVGMFHLITHAFFKALLFLGAGSVIHGCHEEQDIRKMGGLKKLMPVTFATYAVGMMALCGVPLFFSGFWSKDEILDAAIIGRFASAFLSRPVRARF